MTRNKQINEVVTISQERRSHRTVDENTALVRETHDPGMTVALLTPQARCLHTPAAQLSQAKVRRSTYSDLGR